MQRFLITTAVLVATTSAVAEPTTYTVDPDHTSVVFEAKHFGTSTIRARIPAKSGTITIDPSAKTGKVAILLDTNAIAAGVPKFEQTLKSSGYFNTATYPEAAFTATSITYDGDKVTSVSGDLTMLGKSNPVTLKTVSYNCYTSPLHKKQVCGGDFETTIMRSQWNFNSGIPFVPDETRLLVQIEALKS